MGASHRASQTNSNCGPSGAAEPEMRPPVMPGDFQRWSEELRFEEWAARIRGPELVVVPPDGRALSKAAKWKARQGAFYEFVRYLFEKEQMIRAEEAAKLVAIIRKPL